MNDKNMSFECETDKINFVGRCNDLKNPVALTDGIHAIYDDKDNPVEVDLIKRQDVIRNVTDDIDILNKVVSNFNIVKSIIHGHVNYGNDEQIQKITELCKNNNEPCHVCDYGQKNSKMTCMGNCTAGLHCSNVIFHKH